MQLNPELTPERAPGKYTGGITRPQMRRQKQYNKE